ncbi:MAG: tetratricopeptide repeat protein, partial [Candidatus Tectomicrobia bacterium]|nr:tetratricopeptide repeat protein [Candidatus Tectomicrobia bacterium]
MTQTRVICSADGQTAWLSKGLVVLLWGCCLLWGSPIKVFSAEASVAGQTELAYAKGVLEYANRNYLDALLHLRQAIDLEPAHADAQFYLGLSLFRMGEFQDAIDALQTALRLDTAKRYVHHHLGAVYLQMQRYEDALPQFQLAEQYDAANGETQFYLGYTYYQLQQYQKAPTHLQRALEFDASLAQSAQYYRGLAFYAANRNEQAREAFTLVAHTNPATPFADPAQRYLEAIKQRRREQQRFHLQGRIGLEYDDNVVLEPNDDVLEFGKQSDGRTVFTLAAQFLPIRTPTWRLGATYDLFQSVHFDLHDFDVQSHTAGLFAHFNVDRLSLRAEAYFNFTLLDFDHFSNAVTLRPSLIWRQTDTWFAIASMSYTHTDYRESLSESEDPEVRDRDGSLVRAGLRQFVLLHQKKSSLELSYHYETSRNDGTDWEYDSHNVGLGLQTPLGWQVTISLNGDYHRRDYLHINSFDADLPGVLTADDQRKRKDDRLIAA